MPRRDGMRFRWFTYGDVVWAFEADFFACIEHIWEKYNLDFFSNI